MPQRGVQRLKTKTKTIMEKVEDKNYKRKPINTILSLSCIETRALLMSRYGILNCCANISMGHKGKLCRECGVLDNEHHRINECI